MLRTLTSAKSRALEEFKIRVVTASYARCPEGALVGLMSRASVTKTLVTWFKRDMNLSSLETISESDSSGALAVNRADASVPGAAAAPAAQGVWAWGFA